MDGVVEGFHIIPFQGEKRLGRVNVNLSGKKSEVRIVVRPQLTDPRDTQENRRRFCGRREKPQSQGAKPRC